MINIGILNKGPKFNWGKNFGYWYNVKFFKNELRELGYNIEFYDDMSHKFYDSDLIIIDTRSLSDSLKNKIKRKINFNIKNEYLENINKISDFNKNIIWLDLSDSSGTTSFEVLPYVKKYVKKQFYIDKKLYRENFFRNRYYADYYQNKFSVEEKYKFDVCPLSKQFEDKLVLGWNIGVGNYFDVFNFHKSRKYYCIFNSLFNKNYKELFKYTLNYHYTTNKSQDIFYRFNLRNKDKKAAIHFQRNYVNSLLNKKYGLNGKRLDHKSYLEQLKNSKISIGAFGWGEICYREFEAIKMGAAVLFPNVDYLETWPNIYQDNFSYMSYKLDFSDFFEKIELLLNDNDLRENIVKNSQKICRNVYSDEGLNYLTKFFKDISD